METLRSVFQSYGAVKEMRETSWKGHHKFVEFFDVRDVARVLKEMDGQDIGGRRVKIEFSRPSGQGHMRSQSQEATFMPSAAELPNTDHLQQQSWNPDKEICTKPTPASSYVLATDTQEESNAQGHMGIGEVGVGQGDSGLGRRRGNVSYMKSEHSSKTSIGNGCRPSAGSAAWRAHNGRNGGHVSSQFDFDEAEAYPTTPGPERH